MMATWWSIRTDRKRKTLIPNPFKDKEATEFEEDPSEFEQNCGKQAKKPTTG
jgi:hypothetical protein